MLSERQELILGLVVDAYRETGRPVGSKAIAEDARLEWGASTVRAELAALEAGGYLTHPHTSAGRVPTDLGYRQFVESLNPRSVTGRTTSEANLDLTRLQREVDEAMREATAALAQMTDLLALVVAPPLGTARIHRVEALLLQPEVVMVIVITSTGDVSKRAFNFAAPVDPGLVEWASSYLNESLAGIDLGARRIASKLADPGLAPVEAEFVRHLAPALVDLEQDPESTVYVEGTARLLDQRRAADLPRIDQLMSTLEEKAIVLRMMRSAIDERSVFLWIGAENPQPELRNVSVIGANYGLGHRNLGSVGVVGPTRMDYERTIGSVNDAARELSRYFEFVYDS
ncbi:MAG: heat-inducible transcription repressor HrcA [Solirubrobacterales bacterium]|nr:heat-inducible transcription repressor HrcA [Solirubrobacterales bacterium]HMT03983.1 heat-inducible transcriptional repressor HrcA [Solirubrobacterales bacterium]